MSEAKPEQQAVPTLDEAQVLSYLEQNPDFLRRHPDLLDRLEVPHGAGNAVSLIEHQVASLRQGQQQTQDRLQALITAARDNELRVQQMNGLAQVLIRAESTTALVTGLHRFLHRELGVDALFVGVVARRELLAEGIRALSPEGAEMAALTNVFRRGHPICGPLSADQIAALFAETGDTPPQSAALVPLGEDKVRGALVLGSRDARRFVPEMGTLFLKMMGQLVTTACRRHLGSAVI